MIRNESTPRREGGGRRERADLAEARVGHALAAVVDELPEAAAAQELRHKQHHGLGANALYESRHRGWEGGGAVEEDWTNQQRRWTVQCSRQAARTQQHQAGHAGTHGGS